MNIKIPNEVIYKNVTYRVTSIGKYAFSGCQDVKFALAKLGNDAGVYGAAKMLLY